MSCMIHACIIVLVAVCAVPAFAHGGSPYDATTLDLSGNDVTVSTLVQPAALTDDLLEDASFIVNFFDNETGVSFEHVTYLLSIYRHGDLLAQNEFYSHNGTLHVKMRPDSVCPEDQRWKCTVYYGNPHPANGALYTLGENHPVIKGPLIYEGGLYHFKVEIVGAEFANRLLSEPLVFDTYVSVVKEQRFGIPDAV